MIDSSLLLAFADELTKLSEMSEAEKSRQRHQYYIDHRQKLLQTSRAYRVANRADLNRKKRIYTKRVKSGARRQRKRVKRGTMGYQFMGYK